MNDIKERLDKIYDKYGEYLHFNYSNIKEDNNDVELWNIYMNDIGHNNYDNKREFLDFLDFIISKTQEEIVNKRAEDNAEFIELLEEQLEEARDKQKLLEKRLSNMSEKI